MKIREEEVSKKPRKFSFFVEEIKEEVGKKDLEYYLRNDRIYTKAEKEEYKRLKAEREKEILENDEWQRGDWAYEWNADGSLKSVKLPDGQKVAFEYDALGRRTKKVFKDKIKRYLWDGNVLLHEWEYDIKDEPKKIINELGEIGYDKKEPIQNLITWVYEENSFVPCAKIVDNKCYSVVNDYIGRPIQAFDNKGEKVWSAEYDIYGNVRNLYGDRNFVPFRQLGQYEDEETGLYYNRFRYYDCNTGTYISKDPIGLLGGLNVYAYVWDSNTQVDVWGLFPFFRGSKKGEKVSFTPRDPYIDDKGRFRGDYKIDSETGLVKTSHGVSVFSDIDSVVLKGFVANEIIEDSVPDTLQIIQRGSDPKHYEIVPKKPMSVEKYKQELSKIQCKQ